MTQAIEIKQCGRRDGHGSHYWSMGAIDGDSYRCLGLTEMMDRISEIVSEMTVENVLALASRMDEYAARLAIHTRKGGV